MARELGQMMLCRQGIADEPCEDEEADGCLEEQSEREAPDIPAIKSNVGLPRLTPLRYLVYKLGPRHNSFVLAVGASTAFVLFAAVTTWGLGHAWGPPERVPLYGDASCSFGSLEGCPAHDLFASAEVQEVAVSNIINVGRHHFSSDDRFMIGSKVDEGFRNVTRELRIRAPALAKGLTSLRLGKAQRDAVLATLRLISDTKVQEIGFEVGQAIRESVSTEHEHLSRHIMAKLMPRLEEIRHLRESMVPSSLRRLWGSGHQWNITLEPENVGMMLAYGGGLDTVMFRTLSDVYAAGGMDLEVSEDLKSAGAIGGAVEQGRALLEIIKLCMHTYREDMRASLSVTSVATALGLERSAISCQLGHDQRQLGRPDADSVVKAILCPLKFGAQGLDALRAAPTMAGRLPARALFEDASIHEVVAENMLLSGRGFLLPADRELARATVEEGFKAITEQLSDRAPDVAAELDKVPLDKLEREAVIYSVSLMSDKRVQSLGFRVSKAAHHTSSSDRGVLLEALNACLKPFASEVRALREEVMTTWLHRNWDTAGHEWAWALDLNSVLSARAEHGNSSEAERIFHSAKEFSVEDELDTPASSDDKVFALLGGVVEQGRAVIDMIQLSAHLFESDLTVSPWAISLAGTADPETLSCVHRATSEDYRVKFVRALACPLRLGLFGVDAIRSYRDA